MSGLVTAPTLGRSAPAGGDAAFWQRVEELGRVQVELWHATDDSPPILGAPVPRPRQKENARAAERLLEEVAHRCERYPDAEEARRAWREEVRELVRGFGEERLGWPEGYRRLFFAEAFYDTTARFVRESRAIDPEMKFEDVGQALRNAWIMNSLQLLFDLEVAFSPAIFAYSMLYPCTDNLLDDPDVTPEAKADFGRQLGRRLSGAPVLPRSTHEQKAFALVDRIETQYSRRRHPDVFRSLLAIHRAQHASLIQQRGEGDADDEALLRISVAKGGASLLADGYLVAGRLGPEESELCFGYGVFLQLLDDLQDCRADHEVGHATLFTRAAAAGGLDRVTGRLHRFMHRVLGESPRLADPAFSARKDLILRNCTALLVGAVGEHRRRFGPSFVRQVEQRWPVDFASMSRLRRLAERRFRGVARLLSRRTGRNSVLDIL